MLVLAPTAAGLVAAPALRRHAIELRDKGFTVIPDAGLDPALVADARAACSSEFDMLQGGVSELGLDPVYDKYAFSEIATRHRRRWNFQPTKPSAWTRLVDAAVDVATPVVSELHALPPHPDDSVPSVAWMHRLLPAKPAVEQIDAIVSTPGAAAQKFHADAGADHLRLARLSPRHRLINVFCPLVDLAEGGDGTMFWPGSHLAGTREAAYHGAIARSGRLEDDELAMGQMEVPGCPAGGLYLFDFRVLHRGMPNAQGRERAVAHAILSTGFARDQLSFPDASLLQLVDALPSDPRRRRAKSDAIVRQQRQVWSEVRASSAK